MSSLRSLTTILRAPLTPQARLSVTRHHHQFLPTSASLNGARTYHASRASPLPYKNDQDRESLRPQSTQTTGSGTDEAAAQSDAAFDPSTTRPEEEKRAAGKEAGANGSKADSGSGEGGGNPLEMSGANQERSKPQGEDGGEEMKGSVKNAETGQSGGGSPEKKGKPRV